MSLQKETKKYGAMDPSAVDHFIGTNRELWNDSVFRQKGVGIFKKTESILMLFDSENPFSYVPTFNSRCSGLFELIIPTLSTIESWENIGGFWSRVIAANLLPRSTIPIHTDKGFHLTYSKRFHWVIKSNPGVVSIVGNEKLYFAPGEIWQINNRQSHSIENNSDDNRIHIIADFTVDQGPGMDFPAEFEPGSDDYKYFQLRARLSGRMVNRYL
ncbi:MAG: aspartyl/asparaginyl beta-hydroxylase domain-containing protein [Bdellovibrionales bacterium]|nr:aspartyl/asparaginyl beta-hydroxylase domain-containing protein [Bdellovibrionales bacterium]